MVRAGGRKIIEQSIIEQTIKGRESRDFFVWPTLLVFAPSSHYTIG